jgi:hypothetical protein
MPEGGTMRKPITIFHDQGHTQTHDGKHEYLVRPGKFKVQGASSVEFSNDTDYGVTVTLPKQKPVDIPAKQSATLKLSQPPAPAGEYEYPVDVHTRPPQKAHGDFSNPRIVYP